MTTESPPDKRSFNKPTAPADDQLTLTERFQQRFGYWFELPPPELTTLPEAIILRLGISSWPIATLAVGISFYLIFLVLAWLDGVIYQLGNIDVLWYSFTLPVSGTYLLLVQPPLRYLLSNIIDSYRLRAPFNDRFKRLEEAAYTLNRRSEIAAFVVGTLIGWFLLEPPLRRIYPSTIFYDLVGDILVFGLAGWHIYASLYRTKLLAQMHDQVQELNVFQAALSYRHSLQWSIASALVLMGAIILTIFFLPNAQIINPSNLIIYGAFGLSAVLVFVFGRVPTALISQIRMVRAIFLFAMVALVGTVGYHQIEGWALHDALYATIITMTTIGYGDYSPTTQEGRVFTIFLSLVAIGIGGYAVTSFASFIIEGNFSGFLKERRVDKQIVKLNQHYIVCGAGRVGRQLAIEFYKSEVPFVLIEQDSQVIEELLTEVEIPYISGDATSDQSLRLAGINRAQGIVPALSDDKDNVFITLSARTLNPDVQIIARLSNERNRKKLEKAGANKIVSPNAVSGRRMAAEMLNSEVVTLLDEMLLAEQQTGQTLRLEEIYVSEIKEPELVERLQRGEMEVSDIGQRTELMVVAVKRSNCPANIDPYIYTPRGTTRLNAGDILIVMGTPEQRIKLQHDVLDKDHENWLENLWT